MQHNKVLQKTRPHPDAWNHSQAMGIVSSAEGYSISSHCITGTDIVQWLMKNLDIEDPGEEEQWFTGCVKEYSLQEL